MNSSETEAPFLILDLYITSGIVSPKIYDKQDDFNFEIVHLPYLDGDVPPSPLYVVYIKLLKQGYRYHKIRRAFPKFYHIYSRVDR